MGELWELRAEALLPVLQAAARITHSPKFQVKHKGDAVLIPNKEYEDLCEAVESYRLAADREGGNG
jgi:hypothetical protein